MAFPSGWNRRCPLVIQHGQVSANHTAFPVLITNNTNCLPAEMVTLAGSVAAQSNGGDIRFTSDLAGTNQLACEISVWTQSATAALSVAQIWVAVDVLTGSDVTIYVWYNAGGGQTQPSASAPFGSEAVWDANYLLVRHFGNGTTLNLNGSAAGEPTGTNHGASAGAVGAFQGGALNPGLSNGYADTGYTPAGLTNYTLESWVNTANTFTSFPYSSRDASANNGIGLLYENSPGFEFIFSNGGSLTRRSWGSTPTPFIWFHLACSHVSGSNQLVMLQNGVPGGSMTNTSATDPGTGTSLLIAKENSFFSQDGVQELRLSNIVRANSWIIDGYTNQSAPGSFVNAGTPTAVGGGSAIANPFSGVNPIQGFLS